MQEPTVGFLLFCYAIASFTFSLLCGMLGKSSHPLGAYQVYALAMPVWFAVGVGLYGLIKKQVPRLWPPTMAETRAAFASVLILTAETLALLMPQSLIAIVAGKGGCLLLPDPTDHRPIHRKLVLASVVILAVFLASLNKSWRLLPIPLLLAALYMFGFHLKNGAVRMAKDETQSKTGFIAAGQVVVLGLVLTLSGFFGRVTHSAPLSDYRLWLVAAASFACGVIGTRLMLHKTKQAIVFPAYRAMSLCCALGASAARGERLYLSGWLAVALALGVVLWASSEPLLRRLGARLISLFWRAVLGLELARQELAA